MVNIRYAEKRDVYNVSSLIASSWKEHYKGMLDSGFLSSISHDGWADFLDKGMADGSFVCIVAESGGMLLGAAVMRSGSIRKMQGYGELSSLYVKPGETRRGIGSLLLKKAMAYMRSAGLEYCVLDVLSDNANAIDFYSKRGFEMTGVTAKTKQGGKEYGCRIMRKKL